MNKTIFLTTILFLSLLFLLLPEAFANARIEQLSKNIEKMDLSENYVDSLGELAYLYLRVDPSKIPDVAFKAEKIAKKLNYQKGLGDIYSILGSLEKNEGNYSIALEHQLKALAIRKKLKDKGSIANTYHNIGLIHFGQEQMHKAKAAYQNGLDILSKDETTLIMGLLYSRFAEVNRFEGEYNEAILNMDNSIEVYKLLGDSWGLAEAQYIKGTILLKLENFVAAEKLFHESLAYFKTSKDKPNIFDCYNGLGNVNLKQGNTTKAKEYYLKALDFKEIVNESSISAIYYNLGSLFQDEGNLKQALFNYQLAQEASTKEADNFKASIYTEIGTVLKKQAKPQSAKNIYIKALQLFKKDSLSIEKLYLFKNISEVYIDLELKDSALFYAQAHRELQSDLYKEQVEAFNTQTNLEKVKKQNAQLLLLISENKRQSLWDKGLIGFFFLLSLLGSALFHAYRNRKKREIAEYEVDLAHNDIDDLIRDQELQMAYAKMDARDETQKQIGQDLHDRLGVMLSTIKLYFNEFVTQIDEIKESNQQHQIKTFELLDEASKEVRRIAHNMQSGVLKKFGLVHAVKDLAETIENSNQIKVEVFSFGLKKRISNELEGKIYKILQELVGNALKHAKAEKLTISLNRHDDLLNLIVEDDGIGFNPNAISEKAGIGLKNITYRVTEMGGKCHFDSGKGKGTSVIIDIPVV